jgi:hypothetical protein
MPRMLTTMMLALSLALGFTACDNDDDDDEHGHHLEAVGVALVMGTDTLVMAATADPALVEGELHVHEGESVGPVLVHFLDEEGHWFRPEADPDGGHSLEILHNQLALSVALDQEDWTFTATGVSEGETEIVVRILHDGHADYVSPNLPVHVEHSEGAHGAPVGMRLMSGATVLAEAHASGSVTGGLTVAVGSALQLDAWFVDAEGVLFQPEDDHSLGATSANGFSTILTGTQISAETSLWTARISGTNAGGDQLVFQILHDGHSHYTSPDIPLTVTQP